MFSSVFLICSLALVASAYQYSPYYQGQESQYGYPPQYAASQIIKSALGYYPYSSSPAGQEYEGQTPYPYYPSGGSYPSYYYKYPFFAKYFQQYYKGQYENAPYYYPYSSQYYQSPSSSYQGFYPYPASYYQGAYSAGYQGPYQQGYQSPYYQAPYSSYYYQGYQAPYYQGYQGSYPLMNKILGYQQYQPEYVA